MKVLKFGGSSLATADKMRKVLRIVNGEGGDKIVVLSALGGTTNRLLRMVSNIECENLKKAKYIYTQLLEEYKDFVQHLFHSASYREKGLACIHKYFQRIDELIEEPYSLSNKKEMSAQGELISTELFYLLCEEQDLNAALIPALEFMKTDSKDAPDFKHIQSRINENLFNIARTSTYITQGYICKNQRGGFDNLGRGGSDYTATIIGEAVRAEEVQIWTDIDGLHNNDPRFVEKTRPVHGISYNEAERLAFYGAKVLHPLSVTPVKRAAIPLWIKNTFNPEDFGTLICEVPRSMEDNIVSIKDDKMLLTIHSNHQTSESDFFSTVLEVFNGLNATIDMMSVSYQSLSIVTSQQNDLEQLTLQLKKVAVVEVEHHFSIVYISSNFNASINNDVGHILDAIGDVTVKMLSHSKDSCSYLLLLVDSKEGVKVLNRLSRKEPAVRVNQPGNPGMSANYEQLQLVAKER